MKNWIGISLAVLVILSAAVFFSGSLPGVIFGANDLNIEGVAVQRDDPSEPKEASPWAYYGGDAGGSRFFSAAQISKENVSELRKVWEYRTGDASRPAQQRDRSASEGTPIFVEDSLVFCTPYNEIIAINPGTGEEKWRFDSKIDPELRPANRFVCRGVAYWRDEDATAGVCASRILMGTNDARLVAVDARTGKPCNAFGDGGVVSIDPGMKLLWSGEFQITSPPAITGDTVIVGSAISDNARVVAPSGAVRAFDVKSGAQKWTFDPIPRSLDAPNAADWQAAGTPREGHANVWAPMSVDEARGLVFLPTSSASPDFYGGLRPGDNRYANSVVALNVETGAVVWSFQTVHHDVWDYDLPAQPGLYTIWKDGEARDVVAQVTKTGFVFVLDRETGEPVLPVTETPVPQSAAPGEILSPTQPIPALPAIVPNTISPEQAFGLTWFDRRACRNAIASARAEGLFTPVSEQGTLIYPANLGGANWGGAAYDETRNLLVINMSNMAHLVRLIPADEVAAVKEIFHDAEVTPQTGAPFGIKRDTLLSPLGLPCAPPPWGVLAGVDIAAGKIVWRKRFGTTRDLAGGIALPLGTPNVGGPVITGGGLIFIGAAMDNYLRAIDVETGAELWKGRLPAGGQATPMSYEWRGRQYVVIFAGGHAPMGTTFGDSLVAFALPE